MSVLMWTNLLSSSYRIAAALIDSDFANLTRLHAEFHWRKVFERRRNVDHAFMTRFFITVELTRPNNHHNVFQCLQPIAFSCGWNWKCMPPSSGLLTWQELLQVGTDILPLRSWRHGTDSMAAECVVEINQVPSVVRANGRCSSDEPTIHI